MALLDRVKGLFTKSSRVPTLSPYTVEHQKLDEFILDDMRSSSRRFEGVLNTPVEIEKDDGSKETYEQATDLRSDLFFAHHVLTDDVRLEDQREVRPSAKLNAEIMQHFIQHPDFLKTRPMTRNDAVGSALSTMAAEQVLTEELRTTLKDHAEDANEALSEEEKIRQFQELLEQLRQKVREARANGDPIPEELKQAIKQAVKDREEAGQRLQGIAQRMQQGMGSAVAGACAAAAQNAKELTEVYASLPGVGIGAGQQITPEAAIELATKWRQAPNLKRMAELIGRMERDFRWKRSNRVIGGDDIVVGVETGKEIRKVLPHEFGSFGHPTLKRRFYRDFAQSQLLQYEMIGEASGSKGPVIICIDDSGSMSGLSNEWARAVALAVCSIAHRERRPVYVISFSGAVTGEWEFKVRGGIDPEVATDFAMSFNGGGTDITQALKRAREIYEQHPDFKTADILLITDGSDYMDEEDLELKAYFTNRGVRIQGVVIGMDETPYTNEICHDSVAVYDLTEPSAATDRIVQGLT